MLMKTKKVLNKKEYYIAPPIKNMLDKAKHHVIKGDWDRVYIIDGMEGSGKSLLALQIGYYLDPTLNVGRVTFSGEEFSKAIQEAKKNQCIIFDEAFNGLSSSGATSKLNRFIVGKLMECRQKNLFIIVVLPTIFLLQKYAAIFRSRALFHVYTAKGGRRGYYRAYNYANKKLLYLNGQKLYTYYTPRLRKSYVFRGIYPIDEEEYRKKKHDSIQKEVIREKIHRRDKLGGKLIKIMKEQYNISYLRQAEMLNELNFEVDGQNLSRLSSKITEDERLARSNI